MDLFPSHPLPSTLIPNFFYHYFFLTIKNDHLIIFLFTIRIFTNKEIFSTLNITRNFFTRLTLNPCLIDIIVNTHFIFNSTFQNLSYLIIHFNFSNILNSLYNFLTMLLKMAERLQTLHLKGFHSYSKLSKNSFPLSSFKIILS